MIQIDHLQKHFGETCACDIPAFTVNDGDILGLVGNNGAGKTTLFRLLLDLLNPDQGSVVYHFPTTGEETAEAINPAPCLSALPTAKSSDRRSSSETSRLVIR